MDSTRRTAQQTNACGDLAVSVLALLAVCALRSRLAIGRVLAWLVAVVGIADLINATTVGIDDRR